MKSSFVLFAVLVGGIGTVQGCASSGRGAKNPDGVQGCSIAAKSTAPLVVEWNGAERGRLEALRAKHLVAVHYTGCELELLPACTAKGNYSYVPLTPKRDLVKVRDESELYANLPLSAVSLSGKLKSKGELDVSMAVVGRYEAQTESVAREALEGDCARATHFITGLTTGAFDFYAGSSDQAGAGAKLGALGAGADSSSSVEVLSRDGDELACGKASAKDSGPPERCGALIRIELTPIGVQPAPEPACGEHLAWNGTQCVSSGHGDASAPPTCKPGGSLDQGGCPPGPPACPKGTHHEGAGCAPNAASVGAMIRIPGASYRWLDSNDLASVATFDLDVTEVTVAQFKACVDAGKCVPPRASEQRCNWGKDARGRHPINCVNWQEAKNYCEYAKKRLPTDIEWEYAAVGQTGWKYPWGNDGPDATRRCAVSDGNLNTCPVGSFPAGQSRFGVLDMVGNVAEWTLDAWCTGLGEAAYQRGYNGGARSVRNGIGYSGRVDTTPNDSSTDIGFRCARTVAPSSGPRVCPAGTVYALDMCVPASGGQCPPGMHMRTRGVDCLPDGSP